MTRVLVLNAGSSTLKWTSFRGGDETVEAEGAESWSGGDGARAAAIREVVRQAPRFDAVGHRVVHGRDRFRETVAIDARVRSELEALVELDPLHMRPAVEGIDAVLEIHPGVRQFASFDTAFHATLPPAAYTYALPREWTSRWGLRRYGFHGLSVAWSVERARAELGALPKRLIVCHLGSGCSVTAVENGRSVDTTMGFTPLEGLTMGTRSGSVDPGLLLWLESRHGVSPAEMLETLQTRSGLLGMSGVSGDLREVLRAADAGSAEAALAYAQFLQTVRRAVGAMAAVLEGLDAIVFTGGIGENSARVREDVMRAMAFAGPGVRVLVIPAREDRVILREVLAKLG